MAIDEKYFEKLEEKYVKYWYSIEVMKSKAPYVVELAKEIAKYTDDEKKVTRIVNALERARIQSIEDLMKADIDEIAKARNIGTDAVNILRQIKGLPTLSYKDIHPFAKSYSVCFYGRKGYSSRSWAKDFHTLKELYEYFNSDECANASITYIYETDANGELRGDKE